MVANGFLDIATGTLKGNVNNGEYKSSFPVFKWIFLLYKYDYNIL